jgi:hypothetical protein
VFNDAAIGWQKLDDESWAKSACDAIPGRQAGVEFGARVRRTVVDVDQTATPEEPGPVMP